MNRWTLYFMFTFLSVFGTMGIRFPVSGEVCNRIVAVVNDDVVTLYELNERIKELTGAEPLDLETQNAEAFFDARKKVLDLLIDEKIAQDKIKELGFEVSSRGVDAAIEKIKESNQWTHEDLAAFLESKGMNFDQYRKTVKKEIEQGRLIEFEVKSKIIVSDEAIKQYYDDHIDEFKKTDEVRIGLILLEAENPSDPDPGGSLVSKAEQIAHQLKQGEDFTELARRFSQGPNAEDGGDLGYIRTSQIDPKLKKVVDGMKVGSVSDPIITQTGIQFIKVIDKKEKGIESVEHVKNKIHTILYKDEIDKRYSAWIKDLRDKAYIKIIF